MRQETLWPPRRLPLAGWRKGSSELHGNRTCLESGVLVRGRTESLYCRRHRQFKRRSPRRRARELRHSDGALRRGKGLFLNGKSIKLQGTCNHQDHAGVGAALPDRLQYFRAGVLKEMGCNAVRTSHNMPTPEWVDACDRMGLMMMCETRQMSSNPSGMAELEAMIKRYRNSPSIVIWSIGNEENALEGRRMAGQGAKIGASMVELCHRLDPTRVVSAAVNADNRQGVSDALDIIGFNYNLPFAESFHKDFPTRPLFGSETNSVISTRGEYSTVPSRNTMEAYDTAPKHSDTLEALWEFYATREWQAGSFAWTGFDYRGEPRPYSWPSINCYYGTVDMCGFPKDAFYYNQAWWGKEPVLHLFPHWNFEGREGDEIPVWVYSNLDEVELLVNGKSLGRKPVPRLGHVDWQVHYEPGAIEAHGFKDGKQVMTDKRETTGPVVAIRLTADRTEIDADGEDVAMLKVEGARPARTSGADRVEYDLFHRLRSRSADRCGQWRPHLT